MTAAVTVAQSGSPSVSLGFKNRIINGGMTIDQRNAGASVTPSNSYTLDRWFSLNSVASKFTVQQSSTAPVGFKNSMLATSSSAYSVGSGDYFCMGQRIEGFNCSDLAWGTANAKTVTLSFQVYSSLTGTFGGCIRNGAASRSYPFTYTISAATTWTSISVTIPGDTSGTWNTDSNSGIEIDFSLGAGSSFSGTPGSWSGSNYVSATGATSVVGTNGATWYITGVQLEKGTAATQFEFRDYGRELAMCYRYFAKYSQNTTGITGDSGMFNLCNWSTTSAYGAHIYPVPMRTGPSFTYSALADFAYYCAGSTRVPTGMSQQGSSTNRCEMNIAWSSGLTGGDAGWLRISGSTGYVYWDAEL
jgi:hypothetical protein